MERSLRRTPSAGVSGASGSGFEGGLEIGSGISGRECWKDGLVDLRGKEL